MLWRPDVDSQTSARISSLDYSEADAIAFEYTAPSVRITDSSTRTLLYLFVYAQNMLHLSARMNRDIPNPTMAFFAYLGMYSFCTLPEFCEDPRSWPGHGTVMSPMTYLSRRARVHRVPRRLPHGWSCFPLVLPSLLLSDLRQRCSSSSQ